MVYVCGQKLLDLTQRGWGGGVGTGWMRLEKDPFKHPARTIPSCRRFVNGDGEKKIKSEKYFSPERRY